MCCMMMHAMHSNHEAHQAAADNESLLEILKRRYALGEINREQLEQMRLVLGLSASAQAEAATDHAEHRGTS